MALVILGPSKSRRIFHVLRGDGEKIHTNQSTLHQTHVLQSEGDSCRFEANHIRYVNSSQCQLPSNKTTLSDRCLIKCNIYRVILARRTAHPSVYRNGGLEEEDRQ
jgi:hypothetical protein